MNDDATRSSGRLHRLGDGMAWRAVRGAVDAVRYRPRHLDLLLACGHSATQRPAPLVRWGVDAGSSLIRARGIAHAVVSAVASYASSWLGPTASVLVRWASGATALAADHAGGRVADWTLRSGAHPGLLVPHLHEVAILAVDMRGFSQLTRELHDTQYLTDLISSYLTELTTVIEAHRGIVFQYTGDGLLAVFLPELGGASAGETLTNLVDDLCPELHLAFDALYARWQDEWRGDGRPRVTIGFGVGVSFGSTTIGFIGPAGKKHVGVIGEPVNLAAFLCSQAPAGEILVDRAAYARAGAEPPAARMVRLRSKKAHQRIDVLRLRGTSRTPRSFVRLLGPAS